MEGRSHEKRQESKLRSRIVLITGALLISSCSRDPQKAKAKYFAAGQNYMKKGQYGDAAIEFRNALRLDPRFVDAYYQLAQADLAQHDWNAAYASLEKAIELDPQRLDARLDRGRLYLAARQFDNAEDEANFILKQDSTKCRRLSAPWRRADRGAKARPSARSIFKGYGVTAERRQRLCEYGIG